MKLIGTKYIYRCGSCGTVRAFDTVQSDPVLCAACIKETFKVPVRFSAKRALSIIAESELLIIPERINDSEAHQRWLLQKLPEHIRRGRILKEDVLHEQVLNVEVLPMSDGSCDY